MSTSLLAVPVDAALSVRVLSRAGVHVPRIAITYVSEPHACDVFAAEHALTALVWRSSRGKGWDVRPVHGYDERGRIFAGAELVLDAEDSYSLARDGEDVLASVASSIERLKAA